MCECLHVNTNAMPERAPAAYHFDPAPWRALVRWILASYHIDADTGDVDDALRRLAIRAGQRPVEQLTAVLQQVGLAGIVVERPFDEVLRDADTSHPWLTFGARLDRLSPVAVLGARGSRVTVVDPMQSPRPRTVSPAALAQQLGLPDTSAHVCWVLAEPVAPLAAMRSRARETMAPLARLRAMLQGERQTLWVALVYSVVIGLLSLVVPIAVQSLVNTIAFGSALQPLAVLTLLVAVGLGVSAALNALRAVVVEIIQRSLFARTAIDVTHRLLRVRAEAFDDYHGPELVNRFFDVVTVQKSAALLLIDGLSIVMQTVIGLVLLALYHPWLLAFDVLLVVSMVAIVFVLGRGAIATSIGESKAKYALEAWLEQIAAHLVTFKSKGGPEYAARRSQALLDEYLTYRAKHFRILLRQIIGSFALQAVASSMLLGIGGWLVIERQLTLGQLVASELIVALMVSAFTKFGKQLEVFYDLVAAIDKLGTLVDLPLESNGGEAALATAGPAALALDGVQVRYQGAETDALTVAHLTIAAGERLGVSGPIGSGKSTLADVVFGLRAPHRGTILLDGFDLRDIPPGDLRQSVALVRGSEVFPGSVIDNVRLGRDDLSLADVTDALRRVGLYDDVLALPDGLSTRLHPNGRPMSSRQVWRLMIARAIAAHPRLLVIDGALDRIESSDDRERLLPLIFGADAPWTLVCLTDSRDLLAHCSRVITLEGGQVHERHREGEVEA
jgi:putative ABC transport system ATP-binding protein